jgi:hypothetical protein
MGYIFYRIVLLNGVNKNVYKKENSIKLYCRLNGKMIDIKKYKQLCKAPKKSKSKSKAKAKPKAKSNAKDKKKSRRKRKMKGGFLIDFFKNLFNGKTKNEKDLEEANKKYDKLKTEGETICSDANKKTQDAQKEVFKLEAVVNHEKEQKNLKENATKTQNQEQHTQPQTQEQHTQPRAQEQYQSMVPNRNSPLRNTSTTEVYNAKGGKAKKQAKKQAKKRAKKRVKK